MPNFGGKNCSEKCKKIGTFGVNCEYDCECLLNPHCNANYRDCDCKSGDISSECVNICKCSSSRCESGLMGKNCDIPIPLFSWGPNGAGIFL